jgi:hypothetical protein
MISFNTSTLICLLLVVLVVRMPDQPGHTKN